MSDIVNIERKIIERCLEGDIKAQYQLYKMYSVAMYNIAIRLLNNRMDAEDILQDSFVKAFSSLKDLKDPDAFGGWLKRIVVNKCISFHRKNKVMFEEINEQQAREDETGEDLPEIDPAVVHRAIKDLPAKGRTILVLRALEGYKHKEIAELLDISLSTSKTQYSRALALLKKELKTKIYVG